MRLLNTKTGEFVWVEDPRQYHYAILSHVWAAPGDRDYVPELTYQDLCKLQEEARADGCSIISRLPEKLRCFCEMAVKDGFDLGWADTCCIDKTSSSELSEAINSMFNWYAYSGACYAILHDVKPPSEEREWQAGFSRSKWFKRGWTLQELIASRVVIFVYTQKDMDGKSKWETLGSKHSLASLVSSITKIDIQVLTLEKQLSQIPVARRMSWAQSRKTTRVEDEAYCLMGIFGVNLQPNYGEGRQAFIRLQQQILLQNPDQSIFAWGRFLEDSAESLTFLPSYADPGTTLTNVVFDDLASNAFLPQYLLALSPTEFDAKRCTNISLIDSREAFSQRLGITIDDDLYQVIELTQFGLRMQLPLLFVSSHSSHPQAPTHVAILACEDVDRGLVALLLRPRGSRSRFFAGAIIKGSRPTTTISDYYYRATYITPDQLTSFRGPRSFHRMWTLPFVGRRSPVLPMVTNAYISHSPTRGAIEINRNANIREVLNRFSEPFEVQFCNWSRMVLNQKGYSVVLRGSTAEQDASRPEGLSAITIKNPHLDDQNDIIIQNGTICLTLKVGRCHCKLGLEEGVLGVLVASSSNPKALDGKYSREHDLDHEIHIHSWTFLRGTVWRQVEFDSPSKDNERLSLRLAFTTLAPDPGMPAAARTYRLSVEMRERDPSELPMPRQPLPLNPPPEQAVQAVVATADATTPSQPFVGIGVRTTLGMATMVGFLLYGLHWLDRRMLR